MERLELLALLLCGGVFLFGTADAVRYMVGGSSGWSEKVNYTVWAQDKHFYTVDWLFFVYQRNQFNVLEVNQTNYDACNAEHFLRNWTTGAGRDVVPLNVTRDYYFISGNGFCYGGTKVKVHVEDSPPPPASPKNSAGGAGAVSGRRGAMLIAASTAAIVVASLV
ncbi:hypothetical protein M569_10269 [Genlisea aurea]|uniref:Phytocyanin domain-containing protein n=1 Tax=Genlisea aurea TaxID=192259 RepID=S8DX38_9LAMI|nr:hypothetical protein M569_10269 [Genlisea aurea]